MPIFVPPYGKGSFGAGFAGAAALLADNCRALVEKKSALVDLAVLDLLSCESVRAFVPDFVDVLSDGFLSPEFGLTAVVLVVETLEGFVFGRLEADFVLSAGFVFAFTFVLVSTGLTFFEAEPLAPVGAADLERALLVVTVLASGLAAGVEDFVLLAFDTAGLDFFVSGCCRSPARSAEAARARLRRTAPAYCRILTVVDDVMLGRVGACLESFTPTGPVYVDMADKSSKTAAEQLLDANFFTVTHGVVVVACDLEAACSPAHACAEPSDLAS